MNINTDEWDRPFALERMIHATHGAEHVKLEDSVRLTIQHLNEALAALCRKAGAIDRLPDSYARNAFGIAKPSHAQQLDTFDLHREFFDLTYSTISALASVLNRLTRRFKGVPWTSNERFLTWLGGQSHPDHFNTSGSIAVLKSARDFRTIYVHTPQWKPFDWQTLSIGKKASVVLTGTHPPIPPGVELLDNRDGEWIFIAPNPNHILRAFETVTQFLFSTLEPDYENEPNRCKWEEQGYGSAPAIAFEAKVATILAREQGGKPQDYAPELYGLDGPLHQDSE